MASYTAPSRAVCRSAKSGTPNPIVLRRVGCLWLFNAVVSDQGIGRSVSHKRTTYCFWLTINHRQESSCRTRRHCTSLLPFLHGANTYAKIGSKLALAHVDFLTDTCCVYLI